MTFKDKKIETFEVRKLGTNRFPINDPRGYHHITIRVRRLRSEDMSGAMRAVKCGKDPIEYLGKTEYYAVIDLAGEPAEVKGDTIEEVKAQVVKLLSEGPKCEWEDKILVCVEWLLEEDELPEELRRFGSRASSWQHDSLKYHPVRKAKTGMGDYWARGGSDELSAPPKLGKSGGYVSHGSQKEHEAAAVIPDTPENRAILEQITEASRVFHRALGRIVLAGEDTWNEFARRVAEGENIADAANDIASGIVDTPQKEDPEED